MAGRRRTGLWLTLALVLCLLLAATHALWLRAAGEFLVQTDEPEKADAVLVLAGDYYGYRARRGAELVQQGLAPKAYISGPCCIYGQNEGELAIMQMNSLGLKKELFEAVPVMAKSTQEEAAALLGSLRSKGVKRLLVVTSNFHTRRTRRIWRAEAGRQGLEVRVIAADYPEYHPDSWWQDRQGRKVFFMEFLKTVTGPLGI